MHTHTHTHTHTYIHNKIQRDATNALLTLFDIYYFSKNKLSLCLNVALRAANMAEESDLGSQHARALANLMMISKGSKVQKYRKKAQRLVFSSADVDIDTKIHVLTSTSAGLVAIGNFSEASQALEQVNTLYN